MTRILNIKNEIKNDIKHNSMLIWVLILGAVLSLVLILQATFFSAGAIASHQGLQVDRAIDNAAGTTKEIGRNLRDGRTDRLIDMAADSGKDAGDRAKRLGNDIKNDTNRNIGKVQNAAENTKNTIGDRTNDVIDSVKDFLRS